MIRRINLYEGTVTITFDEEKHRFAHINGENIRSVTKITGILDKSRPLVFWAIGLAKNYLLENLQNGKPMTEAVIEEACKQHQVFKKAAADIGTQIHDWAEQWIKGKNPKMPEDEKVRNGAIAFLSWVKETGIKLSNSETVIYSKKYDYAGIMDAEGNIDGQKCIIDFKSSKGIYNEMRYQLAGYWQAREEETGKNYDCGWIIKFGKDDGEFSVLQIPRKDYEKDKKAFLGQWATSKREEELSVK